MPAFRLLVLAVCLAWTSCALAQENARPESPNMPESLRLGYRVLGHRNQVAIAPVVVVVPDQASFIEAVAHWTPVAQFPVLIDDGSTRAREDIARFVRGYSPDRVVRFATDAEMPDQAAERRAVFESALARVYGAGEEPTPSVALIERWGKMNLTPPGVVVADDADEAWVAALALAAGRAQPVVWVKRTAEGSVSGSMTQVAAERLLEQIETGCDRTGLPWRDKGDAIEAVTLCLNTPAKLRADMGENNSEQFALTDLVGRHGALSAGRLKPSERWAWAGQIAGDASSCAYQAMCALFFEPDSAWLFDGYPSSSPWNAFDMIRTAETIERAGLRVDLHDEPGNSLDDWLLTLARAIDESVVLVNSKGRPHDFELGSGKGSYRDAGFLDRPAIVSVVHSWSATRPDDRKTVAGRWRERGAFAYVGSVHEPYLQAFVPTPIVASRLLAGVPLGAAARSDTDGALWKITVLGDPLLTFGKPRALRDAPFGLEGVASLNDELRLATGEERFADSTSLLVMMGRDEQAVRLADAVLADAPDSFDANLAEAVATAAFREASTRVLVAAVDTMGPARSEATGAADAIWLHAQPLLNGDLPPKLAGVLRQNLRAGTVVRDAIALARALRQSGDVSAGNAVLADAERLVDKPREVERLRAERR